MNLATSKDSTEMVEFPFHSLRNISDTEDIGNNRKVFSGKAPIESILSLPTDENVRGYLVEAEGKKRRTPTSVHRAIENTLNNYPDKFSVLNGGVVIVARDYKVNEKDKFLFLQNPSIVNGAQTQGIIKDFVNTRIQNGEKSHQVHIAYELIVTKDEALIAEIAIARNFQNDVKNLSIAGRLGQLDELEASLQAKLPSKKIRKSETQLSEDYLATERLLQTIAALIPMELWLNDKESENPNKVYTYSQKEKCLKDFQELYKIVKKTQEPDKKIPLAKYQELYQFYLDIAAEAYEIHEKWKSHQGFKGTGLRALRRDQNTGAILEVPDGIIFPIIAAYSAFAKKTPEGWKIEPPASFCDEELIRVAKSAYMDVANSDPPTMGKSKACYSSLYQITSLYKRLTSSS